jgi:hypothetical protein
MEITVINRDRSPILVSAGGTRAAVSFEIAAGGGILATVRHARPLDDEARESLEAWCASEWGATPIVGVEYERVVSV